MVLNSYESKVIRYKNIDGQVEIVLESTPFYAEGELADHGTISGPNFVIKVEDVQKLNGVIHHRLDTYRRGISNLTADSTVLASIDVQRRHRKTIHHTATHLLHAGLKNVLGPQVQQKGSVVDTGRLRFDFSHNQPMKSDEVARVEQWVNHEIRLNSAVQVEADVSN